MCLNQFQQKHKTVHSGWWHFKSLSIYKRQRMAEKFIGWPKYSHGMWPIDVYFST